MTLTKTKPRRPTARSQKRVAEHHQKNKHYAKAYWPYLPMVAIVVLGLLLNTWLGRLHQGVLGYATDISVQNIIDGTNSQRGANGLSALDGNGLLNQAAQNKANDMAARDYWSHNTPDGQTPWTFMTAVGYSYRTAGENLAYGFSTSADTMNGWMNSPGHRANILNTTFTEMGVGIADIPNYQNSGPQTLVVAMYGSPYAPAPAPAAVAPAPSAPTPTQAVPQVTPVPIPTATETPLTTNTPEPVVDPKPPAVAAKPQTPVSKPITTVSEPAQHKVSRADLLSSYPAASMSAATTTFLTLGAIGFILIRHGFAWRRYLKDSEKFMLHHPLVDIAAIFVAVAGAILTQAAGVIR